MAHGRVAGLAKLRCPAHQQGWLVRTVRQVACTAILARRWMLPEKRPLFLRMARIAGFIDGLFSQQRIANPRPAVRIVAIPASDLMFPHRVRGQLEQVGPHLPMAIQAQIGLTHPGTDGVDGGVYSMTVGTGDIALFVGATRPTGTPIVGMTLQAEVVLQVRRHVPAQPEIDDRFPLGTLAQHALAMRPDGTVASLALQSRRKR